MPLQFAFSFIRRKHSCKTPPADLDSKNCGHVHDKTYSRRLTWFPRSRNYFDQSQRPSTPLPKLQTKKSNTLNRLLSQSPVDGTNVSGDTEAPIGHISEEESARLNTFAKDFKELMDDLRRESDNEGPPTKSTGGTPLSPIAEVEAEAEDSSTNVNWNVSYIQKSVHQLEPTDAGDEDISEESIQSSSQDGLVDNGMEANSLASKLDARGLPVPLNAVQMSQFQVPSHHDMNDLLNLPSSFYELSEIDDFKLTIESLRAEKELLEAALSRARTTNARLKTHNTLLLHTMDLTWEVARQQLREQSDQVSDLQSQIDSLRRTLHELANVSSDISLYVSPSDEKDRCFLEDQLTTPPATPRHDRIVHGSEIPLPITSLFISERDSPITRSGSWHGPMQTKGILEKERGIEIGRSQIRRRTGSLDLKSMSTTWSVLEEINTQSITGRKTTGDHTKDGNAST